MTTATATVPLTIYVPPGGEVPKYCVCGREIPDAKRKEFGDALAKGESRAHARCGAWFSPVPPAPTPAALVPKEPEPAFTTPPPTSPRRARERRAYVKTEEAIERAEAHADPVFLGEAGRAISDIATKQPTVTSDDVWDELDRRGVSGPREPRALGPVFRAAARSSVIKKTHRTVDSRREQRNRGSVRVWESLIYKSAGPSIA